MAQGGMDGMLTHRRSVRPASAVGSRSEIRYTHRFVKPVTARSTISDIQAPARSPHLVPSKPKLVVVSGGPKQRASTVAKPSAARQQRSRVMMRQIVKKPKTHAKRGGARGKSSVLLTAMAALIFILGLGVSWQGWHTNQAVAAQVKKTAASAPSEGSQPDGSAKPAAAPDTTKPAATAVASYNVAPNLPRYFKMPQFGITGARILPMSVDADGALKTPGNVYDVGWYSSSAQPGGAGAVLLDAHVSSWTTQGVFYNIKNLNTGDTVQVERGDGTVFTYRVVKKQTYDYQHVDMTAAVTPVTAGKPGLNMITCTGKVIPGTNEFDQRVIVFAEQI